MNGQNYRPILLFWLLNCLHTFFDLHCQTAPAVAGQSGAWDVGNGLKYQLTTTVLTRESRRGGDVGFQLTGNVNVYPVWQHPQHPDIYLLSIELESPQLWIKSRKAPEPEGFVEHSSKLDQASTAPILIVWQRGWILNGYLGLDESISSANLKRGIASLFQFQHLDGEYRENDASGSCNVTYQTFGAESVRKVKKFCDEIGISPKNEHPNPVLGVNLISFRSTDYKLDPSLLPVYIKETEQHEVSLKMKPEIGTLVETTRILKFQGDIGCRRVEAKSVKEAVAYLQPGFQVTEMALQEEPPTCPESGCPILDKMIEENRDALDNAELGTAKSAAAFLKLIPLIREASSEELSRILKSPRYKMLRTQILDVLGSAATPTTHQAAMKALMSDDIGDDTERYLWGLSMSPRPHPDIIKDVLMRSEETLQNDRVSETLALTAGAMARQLGDENVKEKVRVSLELGLETCTGDECRLKFLRALRNLRSKSSIPVLLDYTVNGTRSTSIAAWRALGALNPEHVNEDLKIVARRTFYQFGPKRDSTVRTLAADIILQNNPSVNDLRGFLQYLIIGDSMYEVRKYISQRLDQLADKNPTFADKLNFAVHVESKKLKNYNVLAHRGLSTAFNRHFFKSPSTNGSLVTVQEVHSGLLKRGVVDVVVKTDDYEEVLFSLGLFAGGLGTFVSSSSEEENEVPTEAEVATAGMEIDFLGVGIRPFVFFSGQSELMGHVWSGTASDRTPAFQAIANLHRHRELIPLTVGFVAEVDVEGAASFDLAGQIQLSLWSRNAKSLVEMGAGVAVKGGFKIKSDFVQSQSEFALTVEPKLELFTDVDFSSATSLCMQLIQPEAALKYQIYKIERIPGSRHRLRKTKRIVIPSPPKSYFLNKKNNEMCSKVFSN